MKKLTINEIAKLLKEDVKLIQKKERQLNDVCIGQTFAVNGIEFIVLKKEGDRITTITKELFWESKFSELDNNYAGDEQAAIHRILFNFFDIISKGGRVGDYIYYRDVSLKADNGSETYGEIKQRVSLLTLNEYQEYRHLIPNNGKWWLVTPHGTRDTNSTDDICYIDQYGNVEHCNHNDAIGVRPVVVFQKTLFVEIEEVLAISDIGISN